MARAAVQSNVLAAQNKALEAGNLELPVGQTAPGQPQAVDTPPPSSAAWLSELQAEAAAPERLSPEAVERDAALQGEIERQAIPNIQERATEQRAPDEWITPRGARPAKPEFIPSTVQAIESDGGMLSRAEAMSSNIANKQIGFTVQRDPLGNTASDMTKIMHELDAVQIDPVTQTAAPDPLFVQIGSLVAEKNFADLTVDADKQDKTSDPLAAAMQEDRPEYKKPETLSVTNLQSNAKIGNEIYQEYQRMKGVQVPEAALPKEKAEMIGSAFKDMWQKNNPTLAIKVQDPKTGFDVYQLTDEGQALFEKGEAERKLIFPKQQVQPSKIPLPGGKLPGDKGATIVKSQSGRVGKVKFGDTIDEAARNLATIPNVVDAQRTKILYQTLLPVLAGASGPQFDWMANIHGIGPKKAQDFAAAQKNWMRKRDEALASGQEFNEKEYDPAMNMQRLTNKLAQETRSIAQNRKGANYLTYNKMAFNGRLTPQQTMFNPTTSKAVRFVTRNAVPVQVAPGSKREANLRQMYVLLLNDKISGSPMNGADLLLPEERERRLQQASPKLEAWGNRMAEVLTMTDEQYEAVSQAIEEGIPLTDQRFPQVQPLGLDPEQDAELIQTIEKKGEDGPHYMDALIDFAKYQQAKRAGRPHMTTLNAYIDGKTNGLASNGIQMGSFETASTTGVIQARQTGSIVPDGDPRDRLQEFALASIDQGWDGVVDEYLSELNQVARAVYSTRDLNKKTTMTFGYGKEISSFGQDISKTIDDIAEGDPDFAAARDAVLLKGSMNQSKLAEMLLSKYRQSLEMVLSDDAIDNRRLMRGSAMLHAAINDIMHIKSYTGMDILIGGTEGTGAYDTQNVTIYDQGSPDKLPVYNFETEVTSAAARSREKGTFAQPGEYAYGGSLPAPVQSLDAATVALTAAGQSWTKLKQRSNGNPYMHTIYDAFKMDVAGYDTILEEVNENWLKATMEWSYLRETRDATVNAMKKWREENANRPNNDTLSRTERMYMDYMLSLSENSQGKLDMLPYKNKLRAAVRLPDDKKAASHKLNEYAKEMSREMSKVGFNVSNPPAEPNWLQLKTFVGVLNKQLAMKGQFDRAISTTDANKSKLLKQIRANGPVYQYYAH